VTVVHRPYRRGEDQARWKDREVISKPSVWAALLRHELAKLERMGETIRTELREWLKRWE